MTPPVTSIRARPVVDRVTAAGPTVGIVLNALTAPVFMLDGQCCFRLVNSAAEQFFGTSAASLIGRRLADFLAADSPLFALADQVRASGSTISEYDVTLDGPRIGPHLVSIDVAPVMEAPECLTVMLHERSIAEKIDRQLTHRGAARSVTAMAAMLAHELKNPLSGIRGAAQLLEREATPSDTALTRLICEETDRIVTLIDRMEMFADNRPIDRRAVNIHQVLEHVRRLAESGFAAKRRFIELYDPSLPPVLGNRDLLIQLFLNLVKNAAEATEAGDGTITLSTRFQHGVRLSAPGGGARVQVPLLITIEDNGSGIPEHLHQHLFDPFVTTKVGGKGLGLALVAKIVGDHGGVIEFTSEPRRTVFSVMLPAAPPEALELP